MSTRLSSQTVNKNRTRRKARGGRAYSRLARLEQLEYRLLLTTYSSTDIPQAIPDQSKITSTLSVPASVTIDDVNVQLDITHISDQDLDVFLIAPDGTRVELFTDVGGGGHHFSGTTLDDEAATSITAGSAPFNGSFRPEGSLAALDGKDAQGNWLLEITDDKQRKTGTLNSWSIDVTSAGPALPTISIGDVQLAEGASGTTAFVFTVTRSGDTSGASSVSYQTADGTATAGVDYVAIAAATLNFAANETTKTITVDVNGDTTIEPDETFVINLSNPNNATIADAQGQGTITTDDDPPLTFSIGDATINEGGSLDVFVPTGSGGLDDPQGMTFGPDGNVYVATRSITDNVLRFDGATGAFLDEFVTSGSGGLNGPSFITFGPDGNLYVTNHGANNVLRYDGATGAFLDEFVTSGSGGLTIAPGLVFGANGDLYVTNAQTDEVLRYDGLTGAFVEAFVSSGSGGLDGPSDLTFGPDGNLYVGSRGADSAVLRYDGTTGVFIDEFIASASGGLSSPTSVLFGTDGYVYVGSGTGHTILRYDANTGAFIDKLVTSGQGGLNNPKQTAFGSDGNLYLLSRLSDQVLRYSEGLTVSLSSHSQTVTVDYSSVDGTAVAGSDYTSASGTLTFAPGETTKKILLVAIDDIEVEGNETFVVNLSNATGDGTIVDSQGVATIIDNDGPTPITTHAVGALGSLVYQGEADGQFASIGDQDSFTVDLDADQTVTIRVDSQVNSTVTLSYDDGTTVAQLTPPADQDPGPGVLFQSVGPLAAGTLIMDVTGDGTGSYSIELTLNASIDQGVNDTLSTAQDINSSFMDLDPAAGVLDRAVVLGTVEEVPRIFEETEPVFPVTLLAPYNDLRGSWDLVGSDWKINAPGTPGILSPLGEGVVGTTGGDGDGFDTWRFDANAGDTISIRAWGKSSGGGTMRRPPFDLHESGGEIIATGVPVSGGGLSDSQIENFVVGESGSYWIHVGDNSFNQKRASYTLTLDLVTQIDPRPDSVDIYRFDVSVDAPISLTVDPRVQLELFDSTGTSVSSSNLTGDFAEVDYAATVGTYSVKSTPVADAPDGAIDYALVVLLDGAFDHGSNDDFASAQDITGLHGVIGHVGNRIVGYYTDFDEGQTGLAVASSRAGLTAIQITDISTFDFDTIDILMVNEFENAGLSTALSDRLGDIEIWVNGGGVLMVHDRFVSTGPAESNPFLVSRPDILVDRDLNAVFDLDVIYPVVATSLINGPHGTITDTMLDNVTGFGDGSNFGFAVGSTLAETDVRILSSGPNPDNVAAFSYGLGNGSVYYATIPLDALLGGLAGNSLRDNFIEVYSPNVVAYGNGLSTEAPEEDWYQVSNGVFETRTPSDGMDEFLNNLDPHLELYVDQDSDPATAPIPALDGLGDPVVSTPLADGRNETITVPTGAIHFIRVTAEGITAGEYVLVDPPVAETSEENVFSTALAGMFTAVGVASHSRSSDSGLFRTTGPSSLLGSTATLGDGAGLAPTDADHVALVDDRVLRRLHERDTIFGARTEDQELVGDFDAKLLDDELVTLLASEQSGN